MKRYGSKGLGIATGVIAIIFGIAVAVVVGYVACYWWIWQRTSWNITEKGVAMGAFGFFGLIGVLYDIMIALSGLIDIDLFQGESAFTKFGIVIGILLGGVVPGIMYAIYLHSLHSNSDYKNESYSNGYTSAGNSGSGYTSATKKVSRSTKPKPKAKKFSNPGKPKGE